MTVDLNADVGEAFGAWSMGDDARQLCQRGLRLPRERSAGDGPHRRAVCAAGVAPGAHRAIDLRGLGVGRGPDRPILQVAALAGFARAHGAKLVHVKPHGALYNQAATDEALARTVARGVARANRELILVGLAASAVMRRAAHLEGLRFAAEAFADRRYEADGSLQSRAIEGAVLTDPQAVAAQALSIVRDGSAIAADGARVPLRADTLCLHGDTPGAVENARSVRAALEAAGIRVAPLAP
jgi:UPF0271 protein